MVCSVTWTKYAIESVKPAASMTPTKTAASRVSNKLVPPFHSLLGVVSEVYGYNTD
jgi:hypothetical protein